MADANPPPPRRKRIAVVAVHGVADQAPHDSAHAIAKLLLNLNRDERHTRYTPFTEEQISVATRPVVMRPSRERPVQSRASSSIERVRKCFDQRGPEMRMRHRTADHLPFAAQKPGEKPPRSPQPLSMPPEHVFMRDQLAAYKGDGPRGAYHTVRLEGSRIDRTSNEPETDVHVYEMYWADLSKLGTGLVRMVGELYQLLCHLSHLGWHAVDLAYLAYGTPDWRFFKRTHDIAVKLLTLPVLLMHLFIFGVGFVAISGRVTRPVAPALCLLALAGGGAAAWLTYRRSKPQPLEGWRVLAWGLMPIVGAVLTMAAIIGIGSLLRSFSPFNALGFSHLLALECFALLATGAGYLVYEYDRRQEGAIAIAKPLGAAVAMVFLGHLLVAPDSRGGIAWACLRTIELSYFFLVAFWVMFVVAQWLAFSAGVTVQRRAGPGERHRVRRTVWTARLTLAIPAAIMILLGIFAALLLCSLPLGILPNEPYTLKFFPSHRTFDSGYEFVKHLLKLSATSLFDVFLAMLAFALLLAMWAMFPMVLAEAFPRLLPADASRRLGNWLDNGFRLLGYAGRTVFAAVVFLLPLGAAVSWYYEFQDAPGVARIGRVLHAVGLQQEPWVIASAGAVLATPAILVLLVQSRKLTLGLRSVLDIALDVDNHLRVRPLDCTPRAQIAARYASLLRYICRWSDEADGGAYDAVVIIAHSQGTVITTDLLRFVRYESKHGATDASLSRIFGKGKKLPVLFFTMGCPLRQLYGVRFPHLYEWARHEFNEPVPAEGEFDEKRSPLHGMLGVACWVNAFRSGDYVGRHLWRSDRCTNAFDHAIDDAGGAWETSGPQPTPVTGGTSAPRREFCIGAGAHTHYWDGTARPIALQLDRLIYEAACGKPPAW